MFATPGADGDRAVTALSGAGQFTLFSYFAPYFRHVLQAPTDAVEPAAVWFGAFGLIGNLLLTRFIDRVGAQRAVTAMVCLMAISLLLWPLASGVIGIGAGCDALGAAAASPRTRRSRRGWAPPRRRWPRR